MSGGEHKSSGDVAGTTMKLFYCTATLFKVPCCKIQNVFLDFPSGTVDKNLPANARDTGSIPGLGKSHTPQSNSACAPQLLRPAHFRAHEPQRLSLHATTTEACAPRALRFLYFLQLFLVCFLYEMCYKPLIVLYSQLCSLTT